MTYTVHERYDANESFIGGVNHIKTWFVACTQTTIDDDDSESGEDVPIPLCTTIGERKEAEKLVALLNRGAALFLMAQRIIAEGTDPSLVAEARKALGWEDPAADVVISQKGLGLNWIEMPCGHRALNAPEVPLSQMRCLYLCDLLEPEADG